MTLEPCVNLRTLGHRITGVQRYLLSLLPHLPASLAKVRPARSLQGIKGHLWEQLYLPTQLGRRLLWSPGNTGPLSVSRQVLTIHDIATLDHPEWFDRKFALWYGALLPRLIRKVFSVITVSHFSKERIVRLTGVDPERIQVISNGVDQRFRPAQATAVEALKVKLDLKGPYVLFVGSLEPRKNLHLLLEAWRLGGFEGTTLAIAGGSDRLFAKLQFGPLPPGVRLLGWVDDDALPVLYSGATGFVYPSIYEGFGLPPVEAMACGCPVVVSDIPVHREVCGATASYFDPFNPEDLAGKLESFLRLERERRTTLVEAGLERARSYSWEKAASDTWRVLMLATNG